MNSRTAAANFHSIGLSSGVTARLPYEACQLARHVEEVEYVFAPAFSRLYGAATDAEEALHLKAIQTATLTCAPFAQASALGPVTPLPWPPRSARRDRPQARASRQIAVRDRNRSSPRSCAPAQRDLYGPPAAARRRLRPDRDTPRRLGGCT